MQNPPKVHIFTLVSTYTVYFPFMHATWDIYGYPLVYAMIYRVLWNSMLCEFIWFTNMQKNPYAFEFKYSASASSKTRRRCMSWRTEECCCKSEL